MKFAIDEFEFLWAEAVTVLPKVVEGVAKNSFLRDDLTPFEIYIKLLTEYFGASIEYDANSETDLPEGFMRLAYQMDAATQGFLLMQKHNGSLHKITSAKRYDLIIVDEAHKFRNVTSDAVRDRVVDHQLGLNETHSLRLLNLFIAHETLTSGKEKTFLKLAVAAIRKGTFARRPSRQNPRDHPPLPPTGRGGGTRLPKHRNRPFHRGTFPGHHPF